MHSSIKILVIPLIIFLVCLVIILRFAQPATPKEIDLLAGPRGGEYYAKAEQYAAYFQEKGITANVVETGGSRENLLELAEGERPAAGFALAGVDRGMQDTQELGMLLSLGSLSYEPLWLFVSAESEISTWVDLAGKRVGLGPPESDPRSIAMLGLKDNGLDDEILVTPDSPSDPSLMAKALVDGDLDAVFLLGSPTSDPISGLLGSGSINAVSVTRGAAYERLFPEVAEIVLPQGVVDLGNNVPATDLHLLASANNLVVRDDLHPTVVDLLLDAAKGIHREPDLLAPRDTFPNMAHSSLPLSPAAIRFYEEGPSPLRKYLPYWLATLISRFGLILAQVGAVALLVLKMPPMLLRFRFTLQQLEIYRKMEALENGAVKELTLEASKDQLAVIDRQAAELRAPRMQLSQYMELRQNIHDLRERLDLPRGSDSAEQEVVE